MNALSSLLSWILESWLGEHDGAIASLTFAIPFIWVSLAIYVKRWHDRDKSGWWIFIILLPIVGVIWMFISCGLLRGTFGPNQYGPDPT